MAPHEDLRRVRDAQRRFLAAIGGLRDADVAASSNLPDWTVGHVLTHVARNADSHWRRAEAAGRGEVVDQYPGGYATRAAEIEAGAHRTAAALRADVETSAEAMEAAWQRVPEDAWMNVTRDVGGRARPLRELPSRRWQELEVHVVDLGVGITHRDWPEDFVTVWLPQLRRGAAARLPSAAMLPETGRLDERDELAWLYGRLQRADLPTLTPWG